MGVAVPFSNYKYREGTQLETTLASDGPTYNGVSLDWVFTIVPPSGASINQIILSAKDQILLGPSTHPDNPGAREIVTVNSTTYPSVLHVTDQPTYLYLTGDPITGVGTRLAGNWEPSTDDVFDVTPDGIRDTAYGATLIDAGVYDQYRNRIRLQSGTYLDQAIGEECLLANTQYLFGCFYKFPAYDVGGPDLGVAVYDAAACGTGDQIISQKIHYRSAGAQTTWKMFLSTTLEDSSTFTKDGWRGVTGSSSTDCVIRFPLAHGGTTGANSWYETDMPFLCHAQRTDDFRAGIYTFTNYPVLGSTQWSWEDQIRSIRLANGELREYDPTGGGGRIRKHTYQCQFENVDATFFDNLIALQRWQEEGNNLVLITGEQYYGGSIPPVLIGKMKTGQVGKRSWALGLRSFTFTFTET